MQAVACCCYVLMLRFHYRNVTTTFVFQLRPGIKNISSRQKWKNILSSAVPKEFKWLILKDLYTRATFFIRLTLQMARFVFSGVAGMLCIQCIRNAILIQWSEHSLGDSLKYCLDWKSIYRCVSSPLKDGFFAFSSVLLIKKFVRLP